VRKRARALWRLVLWIPVVAALVLLLGLLISHLAAMSYRVRIHDSVADAPTRRVAIVFGAGIWPSGQLSDVLADRVATAVALYQAGKVERLLMTGDNRFIEYNEPQRMKEYAMALGVPEEAIVLDYAGRRTYDSCYRAQYIFEVSEATLVTQAYHLPRALLTCSRLGIDSVGVVADQRRYARITWFRLREIPATLLAWWQVNVTRPEPVLGEKLPIFG